MSKSHVMDSMKSKMRDERLSFMLRSFIGNLFSILVERVSISLVAQSSSRSSLAFLPTTRHSSNQIRWAATLMSKHYLCTKTCFNGWKNQRMTRSALENKHWVVPRGRTRKAPIDTVVPIERCSIVRRGAVNWVLLRHSATDLATKHSVTAIEHQRLDFHSRRELAFAHPLSWSRSCPTDGIRVKLYSFENRANPSRFKHLNSRDG